MTNYQLLNSILLELATAAASGAAYEKWSDDFARKEVAEVWSDKPAPLRRSRGITFTRDDIMALSDDELNSLGFGKWDESGLRLIPIWAFNYIRDGEVLTCINEKDYTKGQDDIDLDHRGGCTAYGFRP